MQFPETMKQLVLALATAVLVFGATAWAAGAGVGGSGGAAAAVGLPRPAPGDVVATSLPDGAPVFVVGHADGEVSVLSAIDTHLQDLVVFCPDSRTFVEPGPVSRWDEYGRYVFGPAPGGLAPYEVQVDGDEIRTGRRLAPPAREVDPVPITEAGDCYQQEGVGGIRHTKEHLPPVIGPDRLPRDGSFVRVQGLLHIPREGPPRVCSAPPSAATCPADAPRVTSTFFEPSYLTSLTGSIRGTFLARSTLLGLEEMAGPKGAIRGWDGLTPRDPQPPGPDVFIRGRIEAVHDVTRQGTAELVLSQTVRTEDGAETFDRGPVRYTLSDRAHIYVMNADGTSDWIRPQELADLVNSSAPYDAMGDLDASGRIANLQVEPSVTAP